MSRNLLNYWLAYQSHSSGALSGAQDSHWLVACAHREPAHSSDPFDACQPAVAGVRQYIHTLALNDSVHNALYHVLSLRALFEAQQADVAAQRELCDALLALPSARVNRYLMQLVYLTASRPGSPLEATLTALCGRSFSSAVLTSWLLLALLQDQPGNRHVAALRDACERAALTGGEVRHAVRAEYER
jgi:hypothetical protein